MGKKNSSILQYEIKCKSFSQQSVEGEFQAGKRKKDYSQCACGAASLMMLLHHYNPGKKRELTVSFCKKLRVNKPAKEKQIDQAYLDESNSNGKTYGTFLPDYELFLKGIVRCNTTECKTPFDEETCRNFIKALSSDAPILVELKEKNGCSHCVVLVGFDLIKCGFVYLDPDYNPEKRSSYRRKMSFNEFKKQWYGISLYISEKASSETKNKR